MERNNKSAIERDLKEEPKWMEQRLTKTSQELSGHKRTGVVLSRAKCTQCSIKRK